MTDQPKPVYTPAVIAAVEQAIARVAAQPAFALDPENGQCLYRHEITAGVCVVCVVGAVIDDIHFSDGMEDTSANEPVITDAIEQSLGVDLTDEDVDLFNGLQFVHDRIAKMEGTTPAHFTKEVIAAQWAIHSWLGPVPAFLAVEV